MPELNENNVVVTNLGRVTAYADAVSAGYRGTREQFAQDQANFAQNAQLARTSAESAKTSADNAKASETITENNKIASESFTHGGTGSRAGEDVDNSQYYYEQCKAASEGISGALIPMGTLAFEDVPPVSTLANGWMYNLSNDFVTTDDFVQGAGYQQTLGTNIYVLTHNGEKKFDILAGTPVTGIKGEKETVYRKGNVSLSAENVGAIPIEELGDADISQIGDGTVTGAIGEINSNLTDYVVVEYLQTTEKAYPPNVVSTVTFTPLKKDGYALVAMDVQVSTYRLIPVYIGGTGYNRVANIYNHTSQEVTTRVIIRHIFVREYA